MVICCYLIAYSLSYFNYSMSSISADDVVPPLVDDLLPSFLGFLTVVSYLSSPEVPEAEFAI